MPLPPDYDLSTSALQLQPSNQGLKLRKKLLLHVIFISYTFLNNLNCMHIMVDCVLCIVYCVLVLGVTKDEIDDEMGTHCAQNKVKHSKLNFDHFLGIFL